MGRRPGTDTVWGKRTVVLTRGANVEVFPLIIRAGRLERSQLQATRYSSSANYRQEVVM